MTSVLDLECSNREIINLITNEKPFSIVRLGIGSETYITFDYVNTNKINEKYLHPTYKTLYNAGIYTNNKDISKILLFIQSYNNAIKNCNLLASFTFNSSNIITIQNYFSNKYNLPHTFTFSRTILSSSRKYKTVDALFIGKKSISDKSFC
jgi:hypothetical protein